MEATLEKWRGELVGISQPPTRTVVCGFEGVK